MTSININFKNHIGIVNPKNGRHKFLKRQQKIGRKLVRLEKEPFAKIFDSKIYVLTFRKEFGKSSWNEVDKSNPLVRKVVRNLK